VSELVFAFKIVWYENADGYMGKVVGIPDTEVGADCWEALYDGLVRQVDDYIDELRESSSLRPKGEKIKLAFEQVSEEEFGPLFPDEEWDEEDEE
jgi:hypothetical protein